MEILLINTKNDKTSEDKYKEEKKNQKRAIEALNLANIVSGGIASTLIAQPRWQHQIKKAGFNVLKFNGADLKTDYCLVFQYNPDRLTESHKVNYDVDRDIFNGNFTTRFAGKNPTQLSLTLLVDSFYDYVKDDFTTSLISGVVQGALLAVKAGSNGFDTLTYATDVVGDYLPDGKIKSSLYADRNIVEALKNLRDLVKIQEDAYYSYDTGSGKFTKITDKKDGCLIISRPPVTCTLDWEGYSDLRFVVTSMDITSIMFNPKNLKPMRCTVNFELMEYSDTLADAISSIDGGTLLNLFKNEEAL